MPTIANTHNQELFPILSYNKSTVVTQSFSKTVEMPVEAQIPEEVYIDPLTVNPVTPEIPYFGRINLKNMGGYGTGELGVRHFSNQTPRNYMINHYRRLVGLVDSTNRVFRFNYSNEYIIDSEEIPPIGVGNEVLLIVSKRHHGTQQITDPLGCYQFNRIEKYETDGSTYGRVTFVDPVDLSNFKNININALVSWFHFQMVVIPNYESIIVDENINLVPGTWSDSKECGGILAFRCKSKAKIYGNLLSTTYGPKRVDSICMNHSSLIDQFLVTGNIFVCSKILDIEGHVGSNFDGDKKGGIGGLGSRNSNSGRQGGDGTKGLVGCGGDGGRSSKGTTNIGKGTFAGFHGGRGSTHGDMPPQSPYGIGSSDSFAPPNVILISDRLKLKSGSLSTGGGAGGGNIGGNSSTGGFHDPSSNSMYAGYGANINGEAISASNTPLSGVTAVTMATSGGCGYGGGGGGGGSVSGGWSWGTNPLLDDYAGGSGGGGGGSGTGFCFLGYKSAYILRKL